MQQSQIILRSELAPGQDCESNGIRQPKREQVAAIMPPKHRCVCRSSKLWPACRPDVYMAVGQK